MTTTTPTPDNTTLEAALNAEYEDVLGSAYPTPIETTHDLATHLSSTQWRQGSDYWPTGVTARWVPTDGYVSLGLTGDWDADDENPPVGDSLMLHIDGHDAPVAQAWVSAGVIHVQDLRGEQARRVVVHPSDAGDGDLVLREVA